MFTILKALMIFALSFAAALGTYKYSLQYICEYFNFDKYTKLASSMDITNSQIAAAFLAIVAFSITSSITRFIVNKIVP